MQIAFFNVWNMVIIMFLFALKHNQSLPLPSSHGSLFTSLLETLHAAAAKSLQSCPTLRPQRWQPTRLPHPWDSPGKNTGMGCHFLLQCMQVKSEREVAQSYPTPSDPMDCSLHQAPPSIGFSRQEYQSGVPLPSLNIGHS